MEQIKVVSFWGCETNPSADPETAGDGGGYFQPSGGCLVQLSNGEEVVVELDDLSCGDFGTRKFWSVHAIRRGMCWMWCTGSMDDACIDPDWYIEQVYQSIWGVLGVNLDVLMYLVRDAVNLAAYRMGEVMKSESA